MGTFQNIYPTLFCPRMSEHSLRYPNLIPRYLWTGQRIEKFYDLLVKDVLATGDVDVLDTKDKKQKCQQVLYDFKNSSFFCKAYIIQTVVKLAICLAVLGWSLLDQCNLLRESFQTELECKVLNF